MRQGNQDLIKGQSVDCTAGCLLDYEYIKNHQRLKAVNLSRQKELDADPKAIPEIKFVGQLKSTYYAIVDGEPMFVLTILEKKLKMRLKFSQ